MQYTLRNVPAAIDTLLRQRARAAGKSLNEVTLDALVRGLGVTEGALKHRDLGDVAGTWQPDRATDEALAAQRRVDPELWR